MGKIPAFAGMIQQNIMSINDGYDDLIDMCTLSCCSVFQ